MFRGCAARRVDTRQLCPAAIDARSTTVRNVATQILRGRQLSNYVRNRRKNPNQPPGYVLTQQTWEQADGSSANNAYYRYAV